MPNTKNKAFLLLVFFLLLAQISFARHIIGGEITYECNGNGNYTFTLLIYRDCLGNGADFDSAPGALVGTVTFFSNGQVIDVEELPTPVEDSVAPSINNPCVEIPSNVCVERAVYVFDYNLPNSPSTYTISYQRCCRNNSITNIFTPESTGATYTIDLVPEAQALCNNSPTFNNFPPIVICSNEELIFDHSATDVDGDQLIYEFCSPFVGGGLAGTGMTAGQASDPNGVAPDPETPPPYQNVSFILPTYTPLNPLAGNPLVTINSNTGLITGIPRINGQYVVGVCVSEFRNGQLLSVVKRDFQFNVTTCDPLVEADIVEDVILGDKEFVINSCGVNDIQFQNESFDRNNITEYSWEFEINGVVEKFTDWEPLINFPDTGLYEGVLILNPGLECGDTATIYVNVYPPIYADFDFEYDTCIAGPVVFTDSSSTGAPLIVDWNWDFGDGEGSGEKDPKHLYSEPGERTVILRVTDSNECSDQFSAIINWSPAPTEVVVMPSSFLGCTPGNVFFNNLSSPIDSTYDITWDFGDGTFGSEVSPSHTYTDPGVYSVSLRIISPFGCEIGDDFPDWITIQQGPVADFTFSPQKVTSLENTVEFFDQSIDAERWQWDFGLGASREQNPIYTFRDTGQQDIVLIVYHENGCQDTAYAKIDVEPVSRYFIPNAFTPNNDTRNDLYQGVGTLDDILDFQMLIWDRWGELIFQTTDPYEGWNGKKNNVGRDEPNGVYIVLVNYTGPRGNSFEIKEFATLIR